MIDNASYHKSQHTRDIIEKLRIRVLYSGPYSYDLSPAEKFFAIIKGKGLDIEDHSKYAIYLQLTSYYRPSKELVEEMANNLNRGDCDRFKGMFDKTLNIVSQYIEEGSHLLN